MFSMKQKTLIALQGGPRTDNVTKQDLSAKATALPEKRNEVSEEKINDEIDKNSSRNQILNTDFFFFFILD